MSAGLQRCSPREGSIHELPALRARFGLDRPFDLARTCRPLTDGGSDPTWSIADGLVRHALSTPEGPAAVEVRHCAAPPHGSLEVQAFGPGAGWILTRVPRMLGLHDEPVGFEPDLHPLVARIAALRTGVRFGASLRVRDALVPVVLGQRVTVGEARRSWWRLVTRHGSRAPGLADLWVPPAPSVLERLGSAEWHRLGVDRGRSDTIRRTLPMLPAIERAAERSSHELQRVITTVRGIGPWTATALASTVLGDPDAVLLGDLHLPHTVCWALAREPRGSDERMLQLLEPWKGHRGRVVRLVRTAGLGAPKRGPRYSPMPMDRW